MMKASKNSQNTPLCSEGHFVPVSAQTFLAAREIDVSFSIPGNVLVNLGKGG